MKTAKELFSIDEKDGSDYACYQPMLDEFGEILLQIDDADYQGDSRLLYKDNNKIGYLNFGWGSCSGCDALQACDTVTTLSVKTNSFLLRANAQSKR